MKIAKPRTTPSPRLALLVEDDPFFQRVLAQAVAALRTTWLIQGLRRADLLAGRQSGEGKGAVIGFATLPQTPGTTTLVGPSPVSRRPGCQEAPDPWTMAIGQGTPPPLFTPSWHPSNLPKITK